jgi:hypothetical protein
MLDFFSDLINSTPIQHLINYWEIWTLFVCISFGLLAMINKKSPK